MALRKSYSSKTFYARVKNHLMNKKRVFVAVNLPSNIKTALVSFQERWSQLPARWIKRENLHLTLIFLGYLFDEELWRVCKCVKGVAVRHPVFSITLERVLYGPDKKLPPRLVWAEGKGSRELTALTTDLAQTIAQQIHFLQANRPFIPHVTLARIKTWEWSRLEEEERPEINEEIDLSFDVTSIDVMESRLQRGGAEYAALAKYPLGER